MSEYISEPGKGSNSPEKKGLTPSVAAVIAVAVVALACVASFMATVILVLEEIPFHHIFD